MKHLATLFLAAAALATPVIADDTVDFTANAGIETDFLYRGVNLSEGDADVSLNGAFKFNNIVIDGVYFGVQANTTSLDDFDVGTQFDVGAGYAREFGKHNVDFSVNRMINPGLYAYDFTEVRGHYGYQINDSFDLYTEVAQQVGDSTDGDTYVAVGGNYFNAFGVENFRLGAQVSGQYYKERGYITRFNNTELLASYLFAERFVVYGKYSDGGENAAGVNLPNEGTVGVKVLF